MSSFLLKLHYGPYEANGVIRHKTQRLHGLLEYLNKWKYMVELVPSVHLNRLTVEMMDRDIFTCDIRNLLFNLPDEHDVVCQRIIETIKDHERMFCTERNIPKHVRIKEGMQWMVRAKMLSAKEMFSSSISLIYEIDNPCNSLTTEYLNKQVKLLPQVSEAGSSDTSHIANKAIPREFLPEYYGFYIDAFVDQGDVLEKCICKADSDLDYMKLLKNYLVEPAQQVSDLTIISCHGPCGAVCPPVKTDPSNSDTTNLATDQNKHFNTSTLSQEDNAANEGTLHNIPELFAELSSDTYSTTTSSSELP